MRYARRVLLVALLLALWEGAQRGGLFSRFRWEELLPPPSALLWELGRMTLSGEIFLHSGASLYRVLIGLALGVAVGVSVGALIAWSRLAEDLLDSLFRMARHIPPLAWIPLSILWFGIRDETAVFVIFIGAVFPMVVSTFAGVRNVEKGLLEAATTLGVTSTVQVLKRVLIPAALPYILSGLRISLGTAWMTVVAAEMVAITSGLGYLIMDARQLFRLDRVIVGMIGIGIIGYLIDAGFLGLERKFMPWRREIRA